MISCRLRPLIVLLVLAATPPIVAQPPSSQDSPAPSSDPEAILEEAQRLTEASERLHQEAEQTLARAAAYEERAHRDVERIVGVTQTAMGWAALILGALALFITVGAIYLEVHWKRELDRISEAYAQLARLRQEFEEFGDRLKSDFEGLDEEYQDTVVGVADGDLLPEEDSPFDECAQTLLADYDVLLFQADRMGLIDPSPAVAAHFVQLARFWRSRRDYCRSLIRIDRAIELDQRSADALMHKAITLSGAIADQRQTGRDTDGDELPPLTSGQQLRLREALNLLQRSDRQRGRPSALSVQQRAFIYDEFEEYDRAIKSYRQAKKLAAEEGPAARSERLSELIGYNLACALTMMGGLDPALDELDLLVGKGPHLESAAKDPQLAALREGEPGVRFQAMLERDRATRNG